MIDLTPARQQLLCNAVDIQDRMLTGIEVFLGGLSHHPDAEVSSVCTEVLGHIKHNRDVLEAMIDGINATRH